MTLAPALGGLLLFPLLWMAVAWAVVQRTGRSGWADTLWSYGVGITGVAAALLPIDGQPLTARNWLVAALVLVWSARLGTHILGRTLKGGDDPRYARLRDEWGADAPRRLFAFLEIQGVVVVVLGLAVLLASRNPAPPGVLDALGVVIAVGAILGEAIADRQLRGFAAEPSNRGKVCDVGLWSLSRHPNYFFEWLHWLGYVAIALAGGWPWGWLTLAAPALMYWLLAHVSGVPLLEAHMMRSRGDAYRHYQRRVRAFWPIPRGRGIVAADEVR